MKSLAPAFFATIVCFGCNDASTKQSAPPVSNAINPDEIRGDPKEITDALQQLGTGFHSFENKNRNLPPAAILGKGGNPLLSWRVAILPYINEAALYQQFKLDEPWDSEHNIKLLPMMPKVYVPRRGPMPRLPGSTYYQVFTGLGAPFRLNSAVGPRISDFQDGTSQTFLIVEASEAVPWTKPADLIYEATQPLPKLGFGDRVYLVLADGSAHFIKKNMGETIFRAAITPNGNERDILYSDARWVLDEGGP